MTFEYKPQNVDELEPQDWPGYEGEWPNLQWPGDAKVCVSFVIHGEAGAEMHETVSWRVLHLHCELGEADVAAQNGDSYPEGWLNEVRLPPPFF
jgi:hypothetical protein